MSETHPADELGVSIGGEVLLFKKLLALVVPPLPPQLKFYKRVASVRLSHIKRAS